MKIPKTLKIGGHTVKVVQEKLRGEPFNGCWEANKNQITIDVELAQSQKESVLIHEVLHVLNSTLGSGMGHNFMDSLAEQIYQVLIDNKLLR